MDLDPETPETMCARFELAREVDALLAVLSPRQRLVLRHRFGFESKNWEPTTLVEVGNLIGVSPERARQIERRALRRLKDPRICRRLREFLPAAKMPEYFSGLAPGQIVRPPLPRHSPRYVPPQPRPKPRLQWTAPTYRQELSGRAGARALLEAAVWSGGGTAPHMSPGAGMVAFCVPKVPELAIYPYLVEVGAGIEHVRGIGLVDMTEFRHPENLRVRSSRASRLFGNRWPQHYRSYVPTQFVERIPVPLTVLKGALA